MSSDIKTKKSMVTVVMPCYNEEGFIERALNSLMDDWVRQNSEILVIDGGSTDRTREIVKKKGIKNLRLLDNPYMFQTYALNLGIAEAKGEIIVRTDAHCIYPPGYIKKMTELLETKCAANVGGVMLPQGEKSIVQKAIALAMQHFIGRGDAKFRSQNFVGYGEGAYLGTFRRTLFDEIGGFDTFAITNEDSELNIRIIKAKKKIFIDSTTKVVYFPRENLRRLAVQYYRYGKGRAYTTRKHKKLTSWRQIAPPLLVLGLFTSLVLALFHPILLIIPIVYAISLLFTAILSWPKKRIPIKIRLIMALAFAVMHLSWGSGFLSKFVIFVLKKPEDRL